MSVETRRRYKVIRLDNFEQIPGEIISANEETGELSMSVKKVGEDAYDTVTHSLGAGGFRIIRR